MQNPITQDMIRTLYFYLLFYFCSSPIYGQVQSITHKMVLIQGGSFEMGDWSGDGEPDERPVHTVKLSDFYIGRYEVTVEEYMVFVNATNSHYPDWLREGGKYNIDTGSNDYYKHFGNALTNGTHPIVGVSWLNAVSYCNWLSEQDNYRPVYTIINRDNVIADWEANGYRLPTEAEWEYAARSGGKQEKWSGTSTEYQLRQYANYHDYGQEDGYSYTAPVGSLLPNASGIYDMSGNSWEWCWDWYKKDFYQQPQDTLNPKGPVSGWNHVVRGGCWDGYPRLLRCTDRLHGVVTKSFFPIGFRLVRSAN